MNEQELGACRLFVEADLAIGGSVALSPQQDHYLRHVLRLRNGAELRAFNGRDGEWLARLVGESRRSARLELVEVIRPQTAPGDLHLLFAPLKQARFDYMVQKAVEMGASRLVPVITRYTQVTRVNETRLRANAIEAAEQCGILSLPQTTNPLQLTKAISELEPNRLLIFCDEAAERENPLHALGGVRRGALAVLIGPEGGFAEEERRALLGRPATLRLSLGPRIMRADTAAVAALALVQATLGDWSE
ncbi:MAG: 16S rRNA (uracil(1498)-N(3))-methyltransferase [Hyphomicrobiales bacterium]|nr:16S rRNA (uracil(1498)-N(3))-methyltransferase [Hyphomicrobiales bacterium]MBV9518927.1 16S rRNA (uracil(1498)-N(3))-methyltransferase [Hyphomicrobiales bacterium]